ncbi:MAG: hypothetical protein ABI553_04445 [Chloroflexota bacterium]
MTEILTESFCERCGTRYTFESARPRVRLKGVKVLSRGLKNFVLSDETTMDEAMASARNETDRELTAHQLDAFHKTFNFCMTCRQYTCPNCWNEVEARCLSCAPHLGHDILPAPFPDLAPIGANGSTGHHVPEADAPGAWPVEFVATPVEIAADPIAFEPSETDFDAAARLEMLTAAPAPAEPPATVEAVVAKPPTALEEPASVELELRPTEPPAVEAFEPAAEVGEISVDDADTDAEAVARLTALVPPPSEADRPKPSDTNLRASIGDKTAAQTGGLLRRFRPGQNLDDELAAYERERTASMAPDERPAALAHAPTIDDDAVLIAEPEIGVEPDIAVEPEAAVAAKPEVFAEPEAVAEPETVVAAEPEVPAEPIAARDKVPQPTWRRVAPDSSPTPAVSPAAPIPAPSAATPAGEPQWPTRPEWLGSAPAAGFPFLNRPIAAQGGIDALWAESNREVVTAPAVPGKLATGGIQPCVSCGLSLSANARFCRRCGTHQTG